MKWKELLIHYKKIIIYYIIGVINTLVDFAVYSGVLFLTHMPVPSQAAGYVSGILCSFCLNRGITFRAEKGGSPFLQFIWFVLVNLVSLGISLGIIHLLTDCMGINGYLAKIPISFITSLINYFGYKWLVFKGEAAQDGGCGEPDGGCGEPDGGCGEQDEEQTDVHNV